MEDVVITIINGIVSVTPNGNTSIQQVLSLMEAQEAINKLISSLANSGANLTGTKLIP